MIPQLSPASIDALNAYGVATTVAALTFVVGMMLRHLPSRWAKAEGKDLIKSGFTAIVVASSILTANFLLGYVQSIAGIPSWDRLLEDMSRVRDGGYATMGVTGSLAIMFATVLAILDTVLKPMALIGTMVVHAMFAVMFTFLAFFAFFATFMIVLSEFVYMMASFASHSYLIIAAGIALFGLKYTRALGISLLVLGLALFYGLPLVLGYTIPKSPDYSPTEDEARGAVELALAKNSVPVKLKVVSANGVPLYFSYLRLNTSLTVSDVPLNTTVAEQITGARGEGRGTINYHFDYGRFYNETYYWGVRCRDPPPGPICIPERYIDYNSTDSTYTQLYKGSYLKYVWYLGLNLLVNEAQRSFNGGRSILEPPVDLSGNIPVSADKALKYYSTLKDDKYYYESVYNRSVEIVVESLYAMNRNATTFALWNETALPRWSPDARGPGPQLFTEHYNLTRTSYSCWIERVYNVTDPYTGENRTVTVYRASATYEYRTPFNQTLPFVRLSGTPLWLIFQDWLYLFDEKGEVKCVQDHYNRGCRGSPYESSPYEGKTFYVNRMGGEYLSTLGLTKGSDKPLLRLNLAMVRERFLPEALIAEANRLPGNAGEGSEITHVVDAPATDIVLNPDTEIFSIGFYHSREIVDEREGSCPEMPKLIPAATSIEMWGEETPMWDPYELGLFSWPDYERTGTYNYVASLPSPYLGGFIPTDRRTIHKFYEEDPREPITRTDPNRGYDLGGYSGVITQLLLAVLAITTTLVGADAISSMLGGTSMGLVSTIGNITRSFMGSFKLPALISLGRNPILFKDVTRAGIKRLIDIIWKDARNALKQEEAKALLRRDFGTLRRIEEFRRVDRGLYRIKLGKRLSKAIPIVNLAWTVADKTSGGRLSNRETFLERRRLELLSRILPNHAAEIMRLEGMGRNVTLSRLDAQQIVSRERGRYGRWVYLAMMAHGEGRRTLVTALTGIPMSVSAAWKEKGHEAPAAIEGKIGLRRTGPVWIPQIKPEFIGPGWSEVHRIERHVVRREEVDQRKLGEAAIARLGDEEVSPSRVLSEVHELSRDFMFREVTAEQIAQAVKIMEDGETPHTETRCPLWTEWPTGEVHYQTIDVDVKRLSVDPKVTIWADDRVYRVGERSESGVTSKEFTSAQEELQDFLKDSTNKLKLDEALRADARERAGLEDVWTDWYWSVSVERGDRVEK